MLLSKPCPPRPELDALIETAKRKMAAMTPEQREAIASGADIFLEQITLGERLQRVRLGCAREPGAAYWHDLYALDALRIGESQRGPQYRIDRLKDVEKANSVGLMPSAIAIDEPGRCGG